jgi:hypothetical protein
MNRSTTARGCVEILIVLFVVIAGDGIQATETRTEDDWKPNVTVDVEPSRPNNGTSLVSCLAPLMATVGHPEWTPARLMGVMGHAFHYEMKKGAATVYHDAPDWWFALDYLPELGTFTKFSVSKRDEGVDRYEVMREARAAVRASLARDTPVLVWQPMTLAMKESGLGAACWGLIVGYNENEESYTIRHPFVSETFTIGYDAFGPADPFEAFEVRILETPNTEDKRDLHHRALQNAVRFANGTQYTDETFKTSDGKQKKPYGFAAYDTWRDAFASGEKLKSAPRRQRHNALMVRRKRRGAAAYLRELTTIFPEAAEHLEAGAAQYDRELQVANSLVELFESVGGRDEYTEAERVSAGKLIAEAVKAERKAVGQIEAALALIEK